MTSQLRKAAWRGPRAIFRKVIRRASRLPGKVQAVARLQRLYEHVQADYYLISFPKCGRTWLRLIIGKALNDHFGLDADAEDILEVTPLAKQHAKIPRIDINHEGFPQLQLPEELDHRKRIFRGQRVILLVRDPRDVVVSLYYQRKKREENYTGSLEEFVYEPRGSLKTIIQFYNLWAKNLDTPARIMLIRYEDMKRDIAAEATRVFRFLGFEDLAAEAIRQACTYASFENMREMEEQGVFDSSRLSPGDESDYQSYKTRRGIVGTYTSELSPASTQYVDTQCRQLLSPLFGYS
jgi:hypothetical protein